MPERVLNMQLNGEEVIEAIVYQIREQLQKTCYLRHGDSYDFMAATVRVDLELHDTGARILETFTAGVDAGVKPDDPETIEKHEMEFDIEPAPPNEVRVQTAQPVPVETKDVDGRPVVKGIRYAKKDAKKVGAVALALFFCLGIGMAQEQQPAPVAPADQLSYAEQLAVQTTAELTKKVSQDQEKVMAQIRALTDDIAKHHPGYHLNTSIGQLEKDPPAPAPKKEK